MPLSPYLTAREARKTPADMPYQSVLPTQAAGPKYVVAARATPRTQMIRLRNT